MLRLNSCSEAHLLCPSVQDCATQICLGRGCGEDCLDRRGRTWQDTGEDCIEIFCVYNCRDVIRM